MCRSKTAKFGLFSPEFRYNCPEFLQDFLPAELLIPI